MSSEDLDYYMNNESVSMYGRLQENNELDGFEPYDREHWFVDTPEGRFLFVNGSDNKSAQVFEFSKDNNKFELINSADPLMPSDGFEIKDISVADNLVFLATGKDGGSAAVAVFDTENRSVLAESAADIDAPSGGYSNLSISAQSDGRFYNVSVTAQRGGDGVDVIDVSYDSISSNVIGSSINASTIAGIGTDLHGVGEGGTNIFLRNNNGTIEFLRYGNDFSGVTEFRNHTFQTKTIFEGHSTTSNAMLEGGDEGTLPIKMWTIGDNVVTLFQSASLESVTVHIGQIQDEPISPDQLGLFILGSFDFSHEKMSYVNPEYGDQVFNGLDDVELEVTSDGSINLVFGFEASSYSHFRLDLNSAEANNIGRYLSNEIKDMSIEPSNMEPEVSDTIYLAVGGQSGQPIIHNTEDGTSVVAFRRWESSANREQAYISTLDEDNNISKHYVKVSSGDDNGSPIIGETITDIVPVGTDGNFAVVWYSSQHGTADPPEVFAKLFDKNLEAYSGQVKLSTHIEGHALHGRLVELDDGDFLFSWTDTSKEFAQRLNSGLDPVGEIITIGEESRGSFTRGSTAKGMFLQNGDEENLSYWDISSDGNIIQFPLDGFSLSNSMYGRLQENNELDGFEPYDREHWFVDTPEGRFLFVNGSDNKSAQVFEFSKDNNKFELINSADPLMPSDGFEIKDISVADNLVFLATGKDGGSAAVAVFDTENRSVLAESAADIDAPSGGYSNLSISAQSDGRFYNVSVTAQRGGDGVDVIDVSYDSISSNVIGSSINASTIVGIGTDLHGVGEDGTNIFLRNNNGTIEFLRYGNDFSGVTEFRNHTFQTKTIFEGHSTTSNAMLEGGDEGTLPIKMWTIGDNVVTLFQSASLESVTVHIGQIQDEPISPDQLGLFILGSFDFSHEKMSYVNPEYGDQVFNGLDDVELEVTSDGSINLVFGFEASSYSHFRLDLNSAEANNIGRYLSNEIKDMSIEPSNMEPEVSDTIYLAVGGQSGQPIIHNTEDGTSVVAFRRWESSANREQAYISTLDEDNNISKHYVKVSSGDDNGSPIIGETITDIVPVGTDGNFAVVWYSSQHGTADPPEVFAKLFDKNLEAYSGQVKLSTHIEGHALHGRLVELDDGDFLFSWTDTSKEFAQRLNSGLEPVGEIITIGEESRGSFTRGSTAKGMFLQNGDEENLSYWDISSDGNIIQFPLDGFSLSNIILEEEPEDEPEEEPVERNEDYQYSDLGSDADFFMGSDDSDYIKTGGGDDKIMSAGGDDVVVVQGQGDVEVDTGAGDDTVIVEDGWSGTLLVKNGSGSNILELQGNQEYFDVDIVDGKVEVITGNGSTITIDEQHSLNEETGLVEISDKGFEYIKIDGYDDEGLLHEGEYAYSSYIVLGSNDANYLVANQLDDAESNDEVYVGAGDGADIIEASAHNVMIEGGEGDDTIRISSTSGKKFVFGDIFNGDSGGIVSSQNSSFADVVEIDWSYEASDIENVAHGYRITNNQLDAVVEVYDVEILKFANGDGTWDTRYLTEGAPVGKDNWMFGNAGKDIAYGDGSDISFVLGNGTAPEGAALSDNGTSDILQVYASVTTTVVETYTYKVKGKTKVGTREVEGSEEALIWEGDRTAVDAFTFSDGVIINVINVADKGWDDAEIEHTLGTDGIDLIFGNDSDNLIDGKGGDDIIFGGDGDDVIIGGDGDDVLVGGAGDDVIRGDGVDADDIAVGMFEDAGVAVSELSLDDTGIMAGNDTILGGDGIDDIESGEGKNLVASGRADMDGDGEADLDTIKEHMTTNKDIFEDDDWI